MTKSEYHTVRQVLHDSAAQSTLDETLSTMGSEGWEVASVTALPITANISGSPEVLVLLRRDVSTP